MNKLIKLSVLSLLVFLLYGCGGDTTYVKTSYAKQTMSIEQAFKHCEFVANDDTRVLEWQYGKNFRVAWNRAYDKCLYKQGYVEE